VLKHLATSPHIEYVVLSARWQYFFADPIFDAAGRRVTPDVDRVARSLSHTIERLQDVREAWGRVASGAARVLARCTLAIVRQNQRWALYYNFSAVPLAALGFVPPWLAALGMSLSSLGVILNAMRIGRGDAKPTRAARFAHSPAEPLPGPAT